MQCPTCGNDTPGTLGKCSHCEAPIDVYSVGPAVPLAAPLADPAVSGTADTLGEQTMMVLPPTPSWAPGPQPPVRPDLAMPPPPTAPPPAASQPPVSQPAAFQQPSPQSAVTGPQAPPPFQPSAEPPAATPGTASPLPPVDPDDTAAWTFDPDEDDSGSFGTVPPPPAWGNGQPALPAHEKPALPAATNPAPQPFGLAPQPEPRESIVPDSWFARPRKPEEPDADATQMWGQQGAAQPPAFQDADATRIAPGPMMGPGPGPHGFGGDLDRTRMDPGAPMGAPPMGAPPMGAPMGPGDPVYGGFPPAQRPPKSGGTSKPLIVAVAALVTVAAGAVAFVAWPSGGDPSASTSPAPSASSTQVAQKNTIPAATKQQAAAMNALLNDSVDTRRILAGALGRAGKCKTLPQAIQGFQTVAQRRQNQLRRTSRLQVDKLANGERLRGSLSQALTTSLQVDQVLLQWAQANQRNCHGKPRPSAAQVPGRAAIEQRATAAKKQFVVLWNPVAKKTGQPQRSWKRV